MVATNQFNNDEDEWEDDDEKDSDELGDDDEEANPAGWGTVVGGDDMDDGTDE